jgi:glycosyltransferase involved in cell wall biosynthesis
MRIAYAVTAPVSAEVLLQDHLKAIAQEGYEVYLLCPSSTSLDEFIIDQGIKFEAIAMNREISLWSDLQSLWKACKMIREIQPDAINYSTPKAALIFSIASKLFGVKHRIYLIRGWRFEGHKGFLRFLLKSFEKAIIALSTERIAISKSLIGVAEKELGIRQTKFKVFGLGSSNGVNLDYYGLNEEMFNKKLKDGNKKVFTLGYIGRLNTDKGIDDILYILKRIKQEGISFTIKVLLIGDYEAFSLVHELKSFKSKYIQVKVLPFTKDLRKYYHMLDLLLFPSKREGFGNVIIEAASYGVPCLAYRVTGVVDAVIDNETGVLIEPGDKEALYTALQNLIANPDKRVELGRNAWVRVHRYFNRKKIIQYWIEFYKMKFSES